MFALFVELEAKPDCLERLEGLLKSMVELSEQESGTVYYSVNRPQERHNTFMLYELYRDRADLETHLQTPLLQEALQQFETLLMQPPKITPCNTVFTTRLGGVDPNP